MTHNLAESKSNSAIIMENTVLKAIAMPAGKQQKYARIELSVGA